MDGEKNSIFGQAGSCQAEVRTNVLQNYDSSIYQNPYFLVSRISERVARQISLIDTTPTNYQDWLIAAIPDSVES